MNSPRVSFVSLGCPKALVDSEHIVTELIDSGYEVVADEQDAAEVLVVNTCGFIDAAKAESFAVIEQALDEQRRVIVTGCLGADRAALLQRYPQLEHISGPAQVRPVLSAVQQHLPIGPSAKSAKPSPREVRQRLTPATFRLPQNF